MLDSLDLYKDQKPLKCVENQQTDWTLKSKQIKKILSNCPDITTLIAHVGQCHVGHILYDMWQVSRIV